MLYLAVWAVLYGLVYSFFRLLFPAALPYAALSYAVLLLVWLGYRGRLKALRICRAAFRGWTDVPVLALLFILPAANRISGGAFAAGDTAVLMIGAVIVEEVFFRGVLLAGPGTSGVPLFEWAAEQPDRAKALFSSGLFAAFHAVNAVSGEDGVRILPQILCAFCAGMLFAAVTFRVNSLIPAAAGHFLVNITASEANAFSLPIMIGSVLCLAAGGILLLLPARHIRRGN